MYYYYCYAKPVLPITIYDRPTYYYYHPMFGYIAPPPYP